MSMMNPKDSRKALQALNPGDFAANANGAEIDTQGYDYAHFACNAGTIAGDTTFKVRESDTLGGTYADVAGAEVVIAAASDNTMKSIGVRLAGRERFIRLRIERASGTSTAAGTCILSGMDRSAELKDADADFVEV